MSVELPLRRASAFASLGLASVALMPGSAGARPISSDDFETTTHPSGFRTVPAGTGMSWYTRNSTGANYTVNIGTDPTFNSKVLNHLDTTTGGGGQALIGVLPENVWLVNTGDFISATFSFRYLNSATATGSNGAFRFGFHSSNGTPVTGDAQSVSDNDTGYYAATGVGPSANAPTSDVTLFVENGNISTVLGGTDRTGATASSGGVSINDNNVHTATFTVTRTGSTTVQVAVAYDGAAAITGTFSSSTTTLRTAFDELTFGDGFNATPTQFVVDNVTVTAVPEPAVAGVGVVGLGLLAVRRRRRSIWTTA